MPSAIPKKNFLLEIWEVVSLWLRKVVLNGFVDHAELLGGEGGETEPLQLLPSLLLSQLIHTILIAKFRSNTELYTIHNCYETRWFYGKHEQY